MFEIIFQIFDRITSAIYEIPVETLVHRKVGNPVEDLKYDLEHAEDLGKFQSILELIKENLNWIWNSFNIH